MSRSTTRYILGVPAVVVVIVAAYALWVVTTPGPLAFAGGKTVALADYHAANPTGVPASLAQADQVTRGEYLARAADCTACHTAPGGKELAGGLGFCLWQNLFDALHRIRIRLCPDCTNLAQIAIPPLRLGICLKGCICLRHA